MFTDITERWRFNYKWQNFFSWSWARDDDVVSLLWTVGVIGYMSRPPSRFVDRIQDATVYYQNVYVTLCISM